MKRRIFSLLIALCLIVGLLPPVAVPHAHAAEAGDVLPYTPKVRMWGAVNSAGVVNVYSHTDYTISTYENAVYTVNTEVEALDISGNTFTATVQTKTGADENNWNTKFVWHVGDDFPTLYIKDMIIDLYNETAPSWMRKNATTASIVDATGIWFQDISSTTTDKAKLVIEGEDNKIEARMGVRFAIPLEIEGGEADKLTAKCARSCIVYSAAGQALTIDANLDLTQVLDYGGNDYAAIANGAAITINGGTISATSNVQGKHGIHAHTGDITINDGTITANAATKTNANAIRAHAGKVIINNGTVTGTSQNSAVLYGAKGIEINDGTVTLTAKTTGKGIETSSSSYNASIKGGTVEINSGSQAFSAEPTLGDGVSMEVSNAGAYWSDYDGSNWNNKYARITTESSDPVCEHANTTTSEVVDQEATCTVPGSKTVTEVCDDCGVTVNTTTEEIPVVDHTYDAVVTDPNCDNGGFTTYTCSVCGDTYVADETAALDHSYNAVVTAPDCVTGGYTTYTCSACGDSYVADEVAALGHKYDNDFDATCNTCGATREAKVAVAKIGNTEYATLAEAVAAANDDDVIVLQASVEGAGIVINKSITIDFNGKTYTFSAPAVGSAGTQTLGFQILENNEVTLTNGKLAVAEAAKYDFAMLIQNYADLTIEDMELDGTWLDRHEIKDYNYSYVLSNNSGNVVIADSTITANDSGDGYAFDSCKYRTYAVPNVEVKGASVINGIVEVTGGNLTINAGEFTGNGSNGLIRVDSGNVTINAGTFEATLGADLYSMAIWAKGGETVIKGGTFKNATDGSERGTDLIYASANGKIVIEGGVFEAATPAWTLNLKDADRATASITVKGGEFKGFDPADNNAEGKGTNFLADKTQHTKCVENVYSICDGTAQEAVKDAESEVAADCTNAGSYDMVVYCECGKELSRETITVDALGHTAAEAVKEHEVPATCGEDGSYDSVVYCSVCTTELSRTPVTVDATGEHDYDDGVVTVEPGLNTEGVKTFTCATCGDTYTQAIAPTNGNAVAKIGTTYYESLIAAYEAAVNGDTITLLKTVTVGEGLVIKKSITIDFGGKTYYVSTPVGSNSTVSNGFQILEEAGEVTLKNGTLRAREDKADLFYILIQNYADLTITDMTLMGKALDKYAFTDGDSYVLSNNSGNVTINGDTTITANEDGDLAYAVDSHKFKTYEAPVVTIEGNVVINGNMELSGGTFNFNGGTFKGTLVYASGSATKADSVKVKTAEEYCWSEAGVLGAHEFVGATCCEYGICAHCGEAGGELAPHNEVVDEGFEATCTLAGKTDGKHCADCGAITVVQHTVLNTGHNLEFVETVNPTNTQSGYDLYVCSHCGARSERNRTAAIKNAVVTFNGAYYSSLADALDAAEAYTGDEEKVITFLRNIRGGALEINFDLTIDFDGHYYTAGANDYSAAVVNNAKLTLKNGILEVNFDDRKTFDTLIVNNGTLNVENMTLKGSHLQKTDVEVPSYIVKNADDATVTTSGEITVLTRNRYAVIGFEL